MTSNNTTLSYKRVLTIFWICFFVVVGSVFIIFKLIADGSFGELPSFEELENPKSSLASEVWSSDNVLIGKYYSQNRSNASFEELPDNLVNALLATEDIRFYKHSGIDPRGLGRVIVRTILLQQGTGGGSTISQQLAKNLFPRERLNLMGLIVRKLKEWIIAVKLEKCYSKKEIITMYLNTVEFNDNAFGIKSAAKTYFNKLPDSLETTESAVLVGMLKAPTYYNPRLNPDNSMDRRNVVLGQMQKYGFISQTEFDSLKIEPIQLNFKAASHIEGIAPYFREFLRMEIQKWCAENDYNLYKDGLKIFTTIDSKMQTLAEESVNEHLSSLQNEFQKHWANRNPWKEFPEELEKSIKNSERYKSLKNYGISHDSILVRLNAPVQMTIFSYAGEIDTLMSPLDSIKYHRMFLQTGFLVIEPNTGYIKAWVGGVNYKYFKFDHVTTRRQIGSTFKPFLYATAIDNGYSPCFKIQDLPVTFEEYDNWSPDNSDGKFSGDMLTLKKCLAGSVNSCSAYLIKALTPKEVIKLARKLGIKSHIDPYPSICLGTPDISLQEMVGSYTGFANKGVYTKPLYITRIEDKNGNLKQEFPIERVEAMSEETAYIMIDMLRNVTNHGTGVRLRFKYKIYSDIGGKTGTTQNHSDGWYLGMTPQLIAGTWVGCEDRFVRFRNLHQGQGANTALPIWALFFQKVYESPSLNIDPEAKFEKPKYELQIEMDCSKYDLLEKQSEESGKYGAEFDKINQ